MIGGFEEPTEGRIFLGDQDVVLPPYKRDVNTVFQSYALFPHMSVEDNVAFGLERKGVAKGELKAGRGDARARGLAGFGRRKPKQLSGGQQQQVALGRALVNHPRVLLLDEPLGALDLKLRKQMQLELKRIQHEVGITFVHVTHDQEEAMTMADRSPSLNRGHIEQLGKPTSSTSVPLRRSSRASSAPRTSCRNHRGIRLDQAGRRNRGPRGVNGRSGLVAAGVRPEKITIGRGGEANELAGTISETAYIGVATQVVVRTTAGVIHVFAQNLDAGGRVPAAGANVILSWAPESTFIVARDDSRTEEETDEPEVDPTGALRRGAAAGRSLHFRPLSPPAAAETAARSRAS